MERNYVGKKITKKRGATLILMWLKGVKYAKATINVRINGP